MKNYTIREIRQEEIPLLGDETPSFIISLYKEHRGKGIGTELTRKMLELLKSKGYKRVSLGVSKENYAVRMYQKVGFIIAGDGSDETEYLMICDFGYGEPSGN